MQIRSDGLYADQMDYMQMDYMGYIYCIYIGIVCVVWYYQYI